MPKVPQKKKAESSSTDSDSGPDDRTPVKKVKTSDAVAESSSTNERGEPYWQLDDKKRVSVASFQGKTRVDIREFYSKDGKLLPGKKGIGLQPAQWRKLLEIAEEVTKALDAQ